MSDLNKSCPICDAEFTQVEEPESGRVCLDSLGRLQDWEFEYAYCRGCSSLFKEYQHSLDDFYINSYEIPRSIFGEDQICGVDDSGKQIFRTDVQVSIIEDIAHRYFSDQTSVSVIDYGCARAQTAIKLSRCTEFEVAGFDLSAQHLGDWGEQSHSVSFATGLVPDEWSEFDIVYSFYALEHVQDINRFLESLVRLCAESGIICVSVPDPLQNLADLIVCDHVNHFGRPGLERLLIRHGMEIVSYDRDRLAGAQICIAKKSKRAIDDHHYSDREDGLTTLPQQLRYWDLLGGELKRVAANRPESVIIHGCGINGIWVCHTLKACGYAGPLTFVDSNSELHGGAVEGITVRSLADVREMLTAGTLVILATAPMYQRPLLETYLAGGCEAAFLIPVEIGVENDGG